MPTTSAASAALSAALCVGVRKPKTCDGEGKPDESSQRGSRLAPRLPFPLLPRVPLVLRAPRRVSTLEYRLCVRSDMVSALPRWRAAQQHSQCTWHGSAQAPTVSVHTHGTTHHQLDGKVVDVARGLVRDGHRQLEDLGVLVEHRTPAARCALADADADGPIRVCLNGLGRSAVLC